MVIPARPIRDLSRAMIRPGPSAADADPLEHGDRRAELSCARAGERAASGSVSTC
jgi:hypothetical protein